MLKKLHIQNYAIIDEIEINFSTQLNIITGETGAGKSILMGALSLILGERADTGALLKQDKKCFNCGLDKWLECDLVLELEHKDGNNKNNQRDNLIALCPNCHSLTKTWRGRNISDKNKTVKLTSQDYIEAYKRNNGNIRKALLDLNIAAKGGNYKIMYKHLDSFNIPYVKRNKSL